MRKTMNNTHSYVFGRYVAAALRRHAMLQLLKFWRHKAAATVLGLLVFPGPVLKAQVAPLQVNYGLTPAMVVKTFKPGQPFEIELVVTNGSPAPVLMRGLAMDFWYNKKNEKIFSPPGTMSHSASNWIEFVPRTFTVPGQSSASVKMIVTPPADAAGSYYSVAFVESKPEMTRAATAESKAMFTNVRLGALILLSSDKSETYKIEVSDARFLPPGPNQDLCLDLVLDNQSNTHIFPRPQIAILNSRHELVAKADGEIKRFLPGQRERISVTWSGDLAADSYTAVLTMVYGDDKIYTQEFPFKLASEKQVVKK
jgi:hypothetical protein